jgi:hypothetical protein
MEKKNCWHEVEDEEYEQYGQSFTNQRGDVLDVLERYGYPTKVFFTKHDPSKIRDGIQRGTKLIFTGNKGEARKFARDFMEKHNGCRRK